MKPDETLARWDMLSDRTPDTETLAAMERMTGVCYRTRSIRSGDMLEIEAYPLLPRHESAKIRRIKPSPEAKKAQNRRNAEKRFRRLAEINFRDHEDYFFTGTIAAKAGESLPTVEEVSRIYNNFILRVNRHRKAAGLAKAKHLGVIEGTSEGSRQTRLHVHMLIEGGLSRDEMEKLWNAGMIVKCERLVKGMLDQLCAYMTKDPKGRKRWKYARGLKQPTVTVADRKISSKAAWRVASDVAGRNAALERLYPGYRMDAREGQEAVEVRTNPYVPGVFISARLRRIEPPAQRKRRRKRWDHPKQGGGAA